MKFLLLEFFILVFCELVLLKSFKFVIFKQIYFLFSGVQRSTPKQETATTTSPVDFHIRSIG
jgi:hypothetical protein